MLHVNSNVPKNSDNTTVSDTIKLPRTPTPAEDPAIWGVGLGVDPSGVGAPVSVELGTTAAVVYVRT